MNEAILRALMQLFAIVANVDEDGDVGLSRTIVRSYLRLHLNKKSQNEYLELFDDFIQAHHKNNEGDVKVRKRTSANSVKVLMICQQINENLQQPQKVLVLIQLLEFIRNGLAITHKEMEFIETVAETFNIPEQEYANISRFVMENPSTVPDKSKLLVVNAQSEVANEEVKHLWRENLHGDVFLLFIPSTNMYAFKFIGTDNLYLNGNNIPIDRTLILDKGASIRSPKVKPIYYSDIASKYLHSMVQSKIVFSAKNVEFRFKNSDNGLHKFNFSEESGHLIGIMGGSGVGKSTLLNVLNGNLRPQSGSITINGFNIHTEKDKLKGVIGFVPQDDLLIEELSVFQNLYYNAKLCFDGFTEIELQAAVEKVLYDLDLFEIRHLQVGTPVNKFISGGQRKRLNIALELIREPAVMFVDEPTSGLSSMDSEMVMDLLKELSMKGKLVIVNIHQPSSDIYKMFDKLLVMDKGGYLIYSGNPIDAITYFKHQTNYVNADESECLACGNVNPEQVLQIIETKVVDEYGRLTKNRKFTSREWYEIYAEDIESKQVPKSGDFPLPENKFKIPNKFKQFKIFALRNILSKLTNKQYLLITFLEAPLLAVILGYFSKYIAGEVGNPDAFVFSLNENLPSYLFMCVVCSLFLGMTISAEEIIKDQRILHRERFLNLSRLSYINSKVVLMFLISAIQSLTFILVGNYILEIKGLNMSYFLIMFTTACWANVLGLNISASLNSVVTIYIMIPFILVPQLLLSGVIVKFDKLHKSIANYNYVSFVGDLMTSRWAYEALAVNQFENNAYQRNFYDIEREMSDAGFKKNFLIPELLTALDYCRNNFHTKDEETQHQVERKITIMHNEIEILMRNYNFSFQYIDSVNNKSFSPNLYKYIKNFLFKTKEHFDERYNDFYARRDVLYSKMIDSIGKDGLIALKKQYNNENLSDFVLNSNDLTKIFETDDRMVQMMDPAYKKPENNFGRAHFYATKKKLFGHEVDTVWFNVIVIWITTLLLYILLVADGLKRGIQSIERIKLRRKKE